MTINLNENQLKNLNAFLARVDLKGGEVGVFSDLIGALFTRPTPEQVFQGQEVEEAIVEEEKSETKE